MNPSTTLGRFLAEERRRSRAAAEVGAIVLQVAAAVKEIAARLARGGLGAPGDGGGGNDPGDRRRMVALADELLLGACEWGGHLAALSSEAHDDPALVRSPHPRGEHLLAFDPLEGGTSLDVDGPAGTIFSVLRQPAGGGAARQDFLQPGAGQVCAGYALYGPCTRLVLTTGRGVQAFTLDPAVGEFVLTHPDLRIPEEARALTIDASSERSWEPPVRRHVEECLAGREGPRGADFDVRWTGSTVGDVHRLLVRGGVLVSPRGAPGAARPGTLCLLHQASPMAMLVEQAGGLASTGRGRLLHEAPGALHARAPAILGSRREVERLERYHADHDDGLDRPYTSPLFNVRSLLREL